MTAAATATHESYVVPPSIVSKLDVSRLVREVEQIDAQLTSVAARAHAGAPQTQPQITASDQLTDFLHSNSLAITMDSNARAVLVKELRLLKDNAPVVTMTFATPADQESLSVLAAWLRKSIHPQAIVAAGLQPALVAGVYVRGVNQVFDMSLRGKLAGRQTQLIAKLEEYRAKR